LRKRPPAPILAHERERQHRRGREVGRRLARAVAFITFVAIAIAVVWITNQLLTERFTESTRNRAEVRLALYTGNLQSELQRNSVVPLLLARDPALIGALNSGDFSQTTQRLIGYREEIGAASLLLLDRRAGRRLDRPHGARLAPSRGALFPRGAAVDDTVFTTARGRTAPSPSAIRGGSRRTGSLWA
jgi:two-component system, NtrC family, C4-dicarboxylate transport sensor histidine kinase DctB